MPTAATKCNVYSFLAHITNPNCYDCISRYPGRVNNRTILTPGGEEAAVAGTPASLASSGHVVVRTNSRRQSSTTLTIAGHTITPNPTSLEIAGTAVKAGEPAVTVSGTSISMGVSGDLTVEGSASTTSPPALVFTVGPQRSVNGRWC